MSNEVEKWKNFANNVKNKKQNVKYNALEKRTVAESSSMVADREMIVQRLASTATDKSMKYERIGPQEFVKYDYEELTIKQNLKDACYKHFKDLSLIHI